jgi:hypothetical protein
MSVQSLSTTRRRGTSPAAGVIFGIVGGAMAFVPCLALFALAYGALAVHCGVVRARERRHAGAARPDWAAIAGAGSGVIACALTIYTVAMMVMSMGM